MINKTFRSPLLFLRYFSPTPARKSRSPYSHSVIPPPDDAARQFQPIVRHNQIETSFDGNHPLVIRKLNSCSGGRKITDRTGVFVTTVFGNGRFVALVACGDPAFLIQNKRP